MKLKQVWAKKRQEFDSKIAETMPKVNTVPKRPTKV